LLLAPSSLSEPRWRALLLKLLLLLLLRPLLVAGRWLVVAGG
jgi:hypothetical protein